ncbi:type II toxin-antitoxin system HicB family antitoxin [Pseudoroseicyclus sp. CXY001]|uniref:type II toxin-antitoxin system HicB family antitoxin n=1 Tax=Pseudoroseicyclus sp. CXY001 TaxID=3242492 RepID=UPI0035710276
MKHFIAVVHQEGDSAYGLHFPDLPGCVSAADRVDDLLPKAIEALQLWFEDMPPVSPGSMADVRRAAAEDIAAGAVLIAVPLIQSEARPVRANISLDRGMLAAIDEAARARGLTRSSFIAEAARKEIEGRH